MDCREDADWERFQFQVPGALRMSPRELKEWSHILPDDELIVLYGCEADWENVLRICRMLLMQGRKAVCLEGGIQAWVSEGFPTERHHCHAAAMNDSHAAAERW